MEERRNAIIGINALSILKTLTLTVEMNFEADEGYTAQVKEFPYAIVNEPTEEMCRTALCYSLKEWAMNLAADFQNWKKGHEQEIPYLIMLLISTEEEISECLRYEK